MILQVYIYIGACRVGGPEDVLGSWMVIGVIDGCR